MQDEQPNLNDPSVGFDDVFGADSDSDLSIQQYEDFWDKARPAAAQKKGVNPNQLVRFVHNRKVHWITQEEADTYLHLANDDDKRENAVKKEIKRALRGETKSVGDELSVLLAISSSILNRYKREEAIPKSEVTRIEPTLRRRFQEVKMNVDCLHDVEGLISNKRKKEPIFDEYENMLGEMMNLKRHGKAQEAARLASELEAKKRQYIILSRSIEPDVYTSYFYRMELEKCKKRILTIQKYLASQRENSLEEEIKHLNGELDELREAKEQDEGLMAQGVTTDMNEYEDRIGRIEQVEEKLKDDEAEMQSIEKESKILVSQIENAEDVISYISEEVLSGCGYEDNIQQQVRLMNAKRRVREPPKFDFTRKTDSRMVTTQRRG